MLRLDPGEGRIRTARQLRVWEGGGEYNVARGLRRCFGLRTAVVTALADNDVGRLVEDLILTGGVDTDHGALGAVRRDRPQRAQRAELHRARLRRARAPSGSPTAGTPPPPSCAPSDVDWDHLFGVDGVRWLHTGGIFAALGEHTADVAEAAMAAARRHGTVVSYDLNYRPSLWRDFGGQARAREVNRRLVQHVDVLIGNEEDFTAALGFEVPGVDESLTDLDVDAFATMIDAVVAELPHLPSSRPRCAGSARRPGTTGARSPGPAAGCTGPRDRPDLEILDRVGGGDSFASGLVYGLLSGLDVAQAVEYGAAHGALAMTTPGDTSMATLDEVRRLVEGGGARVAR